jgi:hypothetical protein
MNGLAWIRNVSTPAVGVMDEDDLFGPEKPLGDGKRTDLVIGDHARRCG